MNELEVDAKALFLEENYQDIFEKYYFVRHDIDKIKVIKDFCLEKKCEINDCMLIEDTYDTLLKAHCEGIIAVHISNILANNISK